MLASLSIRKKLLPLLCLLLCLVLLTGCGQKHAYEYTFTQESMGVTLSGYRDSAEEGITLSGCQCKQPIDLVLWEEINGVPITAIGEGAFKNCKNLLSITIPEGVMSIGAHAFEGCTLTSATIPANCAVGEGAFPESCTVILPAKEPNVQVTYRDGSSGLTITGYEGELPAEAILPGEIDGKPVTAISGDAFEGCRSLTSVTIPEGVMRIGDEAFANCESLTSVTIPNSVTLICDLVFLNCYSLTDIRVAEDNANYSSRDGVLFDKAQTTLLCCTAGKQSYEIPEGVKEIGYGAFVYCESLTSVTIPAGVTRIGNEAFGGCESLTSATIPANCTIGDYAFPDTCTVILK